MPGCWLGQRRRGGCAGGTPPSALRVRRQAGIGRKPVRGWRKAVRYFFINYIQGTIAPFIVDKWVEGIISGIMDAFRDAVQLSKFHFFLPSTCRASLFTVAQKVSQSHHVAQL